MRRIARSQVDKWLLLSTVVGLFGCPLLLEDDFSINAFNLPDAGDTCIGSTCHSPYSNIGGSAGEDGGEPSGGAAGAATAGTGGAGGSGVAGSGSAGSASGGAGGGSAGSDNTGGNAGTSAGSGSAGTSAGSGSAGTSAGSGSAGSGSAGTSGEEDACWTLELTDGTHGSESNCLGIAGTNDIEVDTASSLSVSYQNGDPCFTGTIAATGWGAVYLFNFAPDGETWNANTAETGVTGFEFAYRGDAQPPSVRVMYKDSSGVDNCKAITPGTTLVPFSVAHPSCSTSSSAPVVDTTDMEQMVLAIVPSGGQSYPVNFCVQITALD